MICGIIFGGSRKGGENLGRWEESDELLEYNKGFTDGYQQAIREANNMERVVRCKDCKFYKNVSGTSKWIPCIEKITEPNWFCADGERRDAD